MVASASFDFLRWVRESWAAFRESGWNIFSFLGVGLGLGGPAIGVVENQHQYYRNPVGHEPAFAEGTAVDMSPLLTAFTTGSEDRSAIVTSRR